MDPERWHRIESIFHNALEQPEADRAQFLNQVCVGDDDLRQAVDALLAESSNADRFMSRVALEVAAEIEAAELESSGGTTLFDAIATSPGSAPDGERSIGGYRIIRRLGQGGMGVVYEAEQQHPHRLVALKVVRGGMFVDDLHIALFEREAEALGRLKHAGIAAIYESGRTPDGQPYFAMELVHGLVLDEYIRAALPVRPLTRAQINSIVSLFLRICEAIAYAHQRAVIHRDLKPSNIIVSTEGSADVPSMSASPNVKILDFGLARIADADRLDALTHAGDIRGTLAYMSPEQIRGNPQDTDLRADVYSLGVILYELVVGQRPYDVSGVPLYEAARTIAELQPAPIASAHVDGDLRAIIAKALEKEPDRRYQTVPALADDLSRYLDDLPILAKPPSTADHLRKFVRRHKTGVATAAAALMLLALFAVTMAFQARRLAIERDRANREAVVSTQIANFLMGLFKVSDPSEARGNTITAREILDKGASSIASDLRTQPLVAAQLQTVMGRVYHALGLYDTALPLLQSALAVRQVKLGERHQDVAEALDLVGRVQRDKGQLAPAEANMRQALAIEREIFGPNDPQVADVLNDLGTVVFEKGDLVAAEQLFRDALAIRRATLGDKDEKTADSLNDLAITIENRTADYKTVIELQAQVLALRRAHWQSDHPYVAQALNNLAMAYYRSRQYSEAEPLFREALAMNRRLLGDIHPEVSTNWNNLGLLLRDRREFGAAEQAFLQALEIDRKARGPEHPATIDTLISLAAVKMQAGDPQAAEQLFREALDIQRRTLASDDFRLPTTQGLLGAAIAASKRFPEAEALLIPAYTAIDHRFGGDHPRTQAMLRRVVALYEAWGKPAQANDYRRRVKK
jgi:serine/threonine protein kinase/Tfp pilus assembly protein PilF